MAWAKVRPSVEWGRGERVGVAGGTRGAMLSVVSLMAMVVMVVAELEWHDAAGGWGYSRLWGWILRVSAARKLQTR